VYTVEVDEVAFQVTKPNSEDCWDVPCGAPDPYVVVLVNNREVGRTSPVADKYFASWSTRIDLNLVAGSTVRFVVYDEDLADDDVALNCVADPIDPDLLRGRALGCGNRDVEPSISVTIEPKS
jgi:hypothetical protein